MIGSQLRMLRNTLAAANLGPSTAKTILKSCRAKRRNTTPDGSDPNSDRNQGSPACASRRWREGQDYHQASIIYQNTSQGLRWYTSICLTFAPCHLDGLESHTLASGPCSIRAIMPLSSSLGIIALSAFDLSRCQ